MNEAPDAPSRAPMPPGMPPTLGVSSSLNAAPMSGTNVPGMTLEMTLP